MFQARAWFTRQRSLGVAIGGAVAVGLMAGAAPALAYTTIGQTGTPANSYYYGGDEIVSTTYSVPAEGGKITSFHTQSSSCNTFAGFVQGSYNFQALRPEGGNQYLVLGNTGNRVDPCNSQYNSYPTSIVVRSGDVLGTYIVSDWVGVLYASGFADQFDYQSEPSVGQIVTVSRPDSTYQGLDESATLVSSLDLANQLVSDSTGVGPGHALYEDAEAIQTAVRNGQTATACQDIATYLNAIQKSGLSAAEAAKLRNEATTLANALGCS